jgi:hypothetical protein
MGKRGNEAYTAPRLRRWSSQVSPPLGTRPFWPERRSRIKGERGVRMRKDLIWGGL